MHNPTKKGKIGDDFRTRRGLCVGIGSSLGTVHTADLSAGAGGDARWWGDWSMRLYFAYDLVRSAVCSRCVVTLMHVLTMVQELDTLSLDCVKFFSSELQATIS
jgi:hypothetical protein